MNKPSEPRRALGRGLSSLIQSKPQPASGSTTALTMLPLGDIDPNPVQPRTAFEPDRLRELADSIVANGLIQPLIVRRKGSRYELIAGERRWRAAKQANLFEVPAVIQDYSDDQILEISLIENIQREDLNPIEVAQAFFRLLTDHHLSHEQIATRTGKNRTTITNMLRLLRLPADVQVMVAERRLSMGHARAIVGLENEETMRQVAEKAASQGLSVRQVERLVQRVLEPREEGKIEEAAADPNVSAAVEELQRVLGTRVRIVPRSEQRGTIEIEYYSQEELQRIYTTIVD